MLASKTTEHPGGVRGQLELFRQYALGNFRDMLVQVAKDPAMLVWLDGRLNVKNNPQENFGRELMELFTLGLHYTEQDVYAAARVFTGWNLRVVGASGDPARHYEFIFNANNHETTAKNFSFPIYAGNNTHHSGSRRDRAGRPRLHQRVAAHPETGPRLVRKLWGYFVSELIDPPDAWVHEDRQRLLQNSFEMRPVMRAILHVAQFHDSATYFSRYSWPVEYVARAVKEIGWAGFSIDNALSPMVNMGQQLFEPPDVAGWSLGQDWFTTGSACSRAPTSRRRSTRNQRVNLRNAARSDVKSPQSLMAFVADRVSPAPIGIDVYNELIAYLGANAKWNGDDNELQARVAGAMHLILGSAYYQFV